ncbi:MAG: hypothetical protein FWH40_02245 [Coriobacteriia bacterium]|nr:hypothetical protein [Coriobacteriia bacterium]
MDMHYDDDQILLDTESASTSALAMPMKAADTHEPAEALALPANHPPVVSGMARLHVKMPQGYHYDVYLEKPEGASIQIGWVPDSMPEITDMSDSIVVPARLVSE